MARAARRSPTELLWDAIRYGWVQPWTARFRGGIVTVVGAGLLLAMNGHDAAASAVDEFGVDDGNGRVALGNGLQLGGLAFAGAAGIAAAVIYALSEGEPASKTGVEELAVSGHGARGAGPVTFLPTPGPTPAGLGLALRF